MSYVEGFVVPVAQKHLAACRRMACCTGTVWREHGALEPIECVVDDVEPGKHTSFPQAVKLKEDAVVVFSWIVYSCKRDRNCINKKVIDDPRLAAMMAPKALPFDAKRMFSGGCKILVDL